VGRLRKEVKGEYRVGALRKEVIVAFDEIADDDADAFLKPLEALREDGSDFCVRAKL
jgi:hypothetical protein